MLGHHGGRKGRWYAEHYQDLAHRFGPFDSMLRNYAGSLAALWVAWREATEAAVQGQRLRQIGKGRRPSAAQIERLKRRQGLAWISYDGGLKRFGELVSRNGDGKPLDLAALLARQRVDA
jgi:hypothetical protein